MSATNTKGDGHAAVRRWRNAINGSAHWRAQLKKAKSSEERERAQAGLDAVRLEYKNASRALEEGWPMRETEDTP